MGAAGFGRSALYRPAEVERGGNARAAPRRLRCQDL